MALAQDLSYMNTSVQGNVARPLPSLPVAPQTKRVAKPARAKRMWRLYAVGSLAWVAVMAFFMVQVYRNGLVLTEAKAITGAREQLTLTEQSNQELEAALVRATSVVEIERWAESHGMRRPITIKTLKGDPSAIANRPDPAAPPEETSAGGLAAGILHKLQGLVAQLGYVLRLTASR